MSDESDDDLATRVHHLLAPLRDHVARVSAGFGRRVASGIENFLASRDAKSKSIVDVIGSVFVDSINAATGPETKITNPTKTTNETTKVTKKTEDDDV